ncbi:aspartate/glutamate racemase family protein [Bradyrhizobium sp. LHD-71]|uniref:aspartate/glutamate racemase family protein n=1 Tax=Bradyrhizobium sp. LHD-71 TaxID=3072141 RepID=UPI00280D620E|nr:aspartate/glutamate racemase family protein [Bradyrhizobium sp. LHD-71]MDQ8726126.1 aspartate/glutamate racemase family protein [Bradyrhizobium sp. LHD-71]
MRIWHQSFTVLDNVPAYKALVRAHIDRIKRPDTEVDMHGLLPQTFPSNYPGTDLGYAFLLHMHSTQWAAAALTAADRGYDAFAMCTMLDPLHRHLKTIVDIPVVAAAETAFHVACMHGQRFGMLLFMERVVARYHDQIRECGLSDRCAGIRETGLKFDDIVDGFSAPGKVLDRFSEAARGLIAAGADVLIPGEVPLNVLLATHGVDQIDGVPVIDSLALTIKMTETMVDLRRLTGLRHSRHGFHNAAPAADRTRAVMQFYCPDLVFADVDRQDA